MSVESWIMLAGAWKSASIMFKSLLVTRETKLKGFSFWSFLLLTLDHWLHCWQFLFVFMALKRVVWVVLIRTVSILTGHYIMFSFAKQYHKICILPSQKWLEFPGGWGFFKTQKFKKLCEVLLEFPEGWGEVLEKLPSVGEVLIFFGVTHCLLIRLTNLGRIL